MVVTELSPLLRRKVLRGPRLSWWRSPEDEEEEQREEEDADDPVHTAGAHHVEVAGVHHGLQAKWFSFLETNTKPCRQVGVCGYATREIRRTLLLVAYTP